ncbi:DNA polymerase III, delta subunit [Amphibacillus marinus]|uniref:DNA polymerase III subunit delta n=1 Tax=Amphibacillus marinus TaxID=872970 RepID=A0A1H8NSV9_9BACI|nr:DNA polymerase III subunit delta [Amphibacillus marinus]SEO32674.1 DNA polymerase III, delta subunit [Amphibacillus marinus]
MNYLDAQKELKKTKKNFFLLVGEEQYLIESAVKQVIDSKLSEADRQDNVIKFDMEEATIDTALLEAETYPFFGDEKIVIIDRAYFLTAKQVKTNIEHNIEALINFTNHPVDFATVIIIVPYEKLDERKKITKLVKKQAMYIECATIKEWEIEKWVDQLIEKYGLTIEKQAKELLISETGAHLALIEKEIEKLSLYIGQDQRHITEAVARELVSHQGETSGLKLVDAVIAKDLNRAIQTFKDLLRLNEEPIALIALLASQLRTIYQVKTLIQKGYNQRQITQQLKLHPFVVKMAAERERRFSIEKLYACIDACANTDRLIKQGKYDKLLAFELLLYRLVK